MTPCAVPAQCTSTSVHCVYESSVFIIIRLCVRLRISSSHNPSTRCEAVTSEHQINKLALSNFIIRKVKNFTKTIIYKYNCAYVCEHLMYTANTSQRALACLHLLLVLNNHDVEAAMTGYVNTVQHHKVYSLAYFSIYGKHALKKNTNNLNCLL